MNTRLALLLVFFSMYSCAPPLAKFQVTGDMQAPAVIQFENQSENAEAFQWEFADLGQSSESAPSFAFPSAGNYLVKLTATKGNKSAVAYERVLIEGPNDCMVLIETDMGNMMVKLYNETPEHQANFLKLASEGYYNELLFHRVVQGFMVQGGDPSSRGADPSTALGRGGPGYTIPAEFVDSLVHIKGALAAARTPDSVNPEKRSSGSQFYLVHGGRTTLADLKTEETKSQFNYGEKQKQLYLELGGTAFLDQNYTVFGQVIEGIEVIDKIAASRVGRGNRPVEDIKMKISVVDYFPEKRKP